MKRAIGQSIEEETNWPALVWFNGASGYTEDLHYNGFLDSIASWGFVVVGGKSPGMNGPESDQRDALLARNADSNDALFGRVYREPVIAFLRWQLHQDPAGAGWFEGDRCTLCTDPTWSFDAR